MYQTTKNAGDVDAVWDRSSIVVESSLRTPMVHHLAIEPHVCVAQYTNEKKLHVWTPNQSVFALQGILCDLLSLPPERVHITKTPIGGSFGGKMEAILKPVAALLAMRTGQTVCVEFDRAETIVSSRTRYATCSQIRSAVDESGVIRAQEILMYMAAGAYASSAVNVLNAMSGKYFRLYDIPNLRFRGFSVYTNTPVGGAMRGYGSPQLIAALEIHMDQVAQRLGIDRLELRRRNLSESGKEGTSGPSASGGDRVRACITEGARLFGWDSVPRKNTDRIRYGVGMACGVHGNGVYPYHPDVTALRLEMDADGSVQLATGMHDLGGGTPTVFSQIVGEILGIAPERVRVIEADTEKTPYDLGAYANRNTWVGGAALQIATKKLLGVLEALAAEKAGKLPRMG